RQFRSLIFASLAAALALAATVAVARLTGIDQQLSELFFNQASGRWLIDHDTSGLRLWFYDGPKALIIFFGVFLLCVMLRPSLVPATWMTRGEAAFVFLCLAIVPLVIGVIRNNSNVQCPFTLQQFGGAQSNELAHVSLTGFIEARRPGGCWPSGHASGGFALLCLVFLERRRSTRRLLGLLGVVAGTAMGAYQVARGAHFASHVLVTGLISVLVCGGIAAVFQCITSQKLRFASIDNCAPRMSGSPSSGKARSM
ncbi:MAG: phosphatase PAP2 family protein, partial [Gammaproteobacteria bacterium]|nr:phosphatase PAP2 family protein [Gammaproteobacteria bacterium]